MRVVINEVLVNSTGAAAKAPMNNPAAPSIGISASLRQATGYQPEYFYRSKERGIKPLPASGGFTRL
jgi:hypothetical protein